MKKVQRLRLKTECARSGSRNIQGNETMPKTSVLIVGAGLAGLAAARELERRGCRVIVCEARQRIAGAIWTLRDGLVGMHGEAGGEMIDGEQEEIRQLVRELGIRESRILRGGFSHYRLGNDGRRRMRSASTGWRQTERALEPFVRAYKLNGEEWNGPIASAIAARSIAGWLDAANVTTDVRATAATMRGFFVADPEQLSLLTYVEQITAGSDTAHRKMYRSGWGSGSTTLRHGSRPGRGVGRQRGPTRQAGHFDTARWRRCERCNESHAEGWRGSAAGATLGIFWHRPGISDRRPQLHLG